jgi:molybdopterin-guanine dinucleotide biosynthesis protein A
MTARLPTQAAILLAGGQSRRMGRDKAHLPFEGVPLAARVHATLGEVFPRVLVVGRDRAFPVPEAWCIGDRHPGGGPLEGLATGMEALLSLAQDATVLLAACDMPRVSLPLLRFMAGQQGDWDALVPQSTRGSEPLLAVYSLRVLPRLRAFLALGEHQATRFLQTLRVQPIAAEVVRRYDPSGASFLNLNRPEDVAAALREPFSGA